MPYTPPPELAELNLEQIAEQVAARKLPPIAQWTPERTGDSRMRIAADGSWFHDGGRITRDAMVRAFSGLLMKDETGQHWLISPFEKLTIEVEDAAFIATDMVERAGTLAFRLKTDELIVAGPEHPLVARGDPDTPALYIGVRNGTEARLNRSTYEQLAEHALAQGEDFTVTSNGTTFSLIPA